MAMVNITFDEAADLLSNQEHDEFSEMLKELWGGEANRNLIYLLQFLLTRRQFIVKQRGSEEAYSQLMRPILEKAGIDTIKTVPAVAGGTLLSTGTLAFDLLLDVFKEDIANIHFTFRNGKSQSLLSDVIEYYIDSREKFILKIISYSNLETINDALTTVLMKGTKHTKLRAAALKRRQALTGERPGFMGWLLGSKKTPAVAQASPSSTRSTSLGGAQAAPQPTGFASQQAGGAKVLAS